MKYQILDYKVIESWVTLPDDVMLDMEAVITAPAMGSYQVSMDGRYLGEEETMTDALCLLDRIMERDCYWPNIYLINERGNVDHIVITRESVGA